MRGSVNQREPLNDQQLVRLAELSTLEANNGSWWRQYEAPMELGMTDDDMPQEVLDEIARLLEIIEMWTAASFIIPEENGYVREGDDLPKLIVSPSSTHRTRRPRESSATTATIASTTSSSSPPTSLSSSDSFVTAPTGDALERTSQPSRNAPRRQPVVYIYGLPAYPRERGSSSSTKVIKNFWKNLKAESDCSSCMEKFRVRHLHNLPCKHTYCTPCLRTLIMLAVSDESLFPPRCCITPIPSSTISSTLSHQDKKKYNPKAQELSIPAGSRLYCPKPTCSAWIPPSSQRPGAAEWKCPKQSCRTAICRFCKGESHALGSDCPADQGLEAVLMEAERNGWRRCFKCRTMVELTLGCVHMTCKCRAEFCYVCGAPWKTCECRGDEEFIRREQAREEHVIHIPAQPIQSPRVRRTTRTPLHHAVDPEQRRREIAERIANERRERDRNTAAERRALTITRRYETILAALEDLHFRQRQAMQERQQSTNDEVEDNLEERRGVIEIDLRHLVASARLEAEFRVEVARTRVAVGEGVEGLEVEAAMAAAVKTLFEATAEVEKKRDAWKEEMRVERRKNARRWVAERRWFDSVVETRKESFQERMEREIRGVVERGPNESRSDFS